MTSKPGGASANFGRATYEPPLSPADAEDLPDDPLPAVITEKLAAARRALAELVVALKDEGLDSGAEAHAEHLAFSLDADAVRELETEWGEELLRRREQGRAA